SRTAISASRQATGTAVLECELAVPRCPAKVTSSPVRFANPRVGCIAAPSLARDHTERLRASSSARPRLAFRPSSDLSYQRYAGSYRSNRAPRAKTRFLVRNGFLIGGCLLE